MRTDIRTSISLAAVVFLFSAVFSPAQDRRQGLDLFGQVLRHVKVCPLISDPRGNAGSNPVDFRNLFVGNDTQNVYFLVEFAGDASKNVLSMIHLDTDMDQTTGCNVSIPRLNGSEYGIFLQSPTSGGDFVGNLTSCSAGSDDFPNKGGIRTATHGHFIAVIVPIATLQVLTPATNGFLVWFDGGGNFGPAGYTLH
jgi:hypothetical protein